MALENYALHLSYFHRTVCLAQTACVHTLKLTVFVSNKGSGEAPDRVLNLPDLPGISRWSIGRVIVRFVGRCICICVCVRMNVWLFVKLLETHACCTQNIPILNSARAEGPALKVPERSCWGVEGSEWSNYFMAQIQLSRGGTFIYTVFISVQRRPNSTVHHVTDWKLDWTTQLEPCLTRLKQLLFLGITETHFRDLIIFTVVVPT